MLEKKNKIINRLAAGVQDMDEAMTVEAAQKALQIGLDPLRAINEGIVTGMNEAGKLYEQEEYFVSEILLCSDALYVGMDVLPPHIRSANAPQANTKSATGAVKMAKHLVRLEIQARVV